MRHKLIASQDYLLNDGESVLIVPPKHLAADPNYCGGIHLVRN